MATPEIAGRRVLAFCDYYSPKSTGGAERVAREVCVRLARAGASVTVMSALDLPTYHDAGVEVLPLRAYDMSPYLKAQLAISPSYMRHAVTLARRVEPEVIYTQSLHFQGSLVAAQLARKLDVPLVTVAHVADLAHLRGIARTLGEAHERTAGRWIMSRSARMIAVSSAVREHCIDRGADGRKVTIVHNGVDHTLFPESDEPLGDNIHIVFVGRLIANKGPQLLIEAAELLHDRDVRFTMTFVGDGPLKRAIEARCAGLPVTCVGASEDVPSWLRSANIVVRPSYTEGMPLTILEAMASRRCVVASDIAANREIVHGGVTGSLHRCGDSRSLADEIEILSRRPAHRAALARAGFERARDYTWENTALGHARVLASVAARGGLLSDAQAR